MRSRSFRLIVNVSMLWPDCYRNPANGDISIELQRGHSHGVPTLFFIAGGYCAYIWHSGWPAFFFLIFGIPATVLFFMMVLPIF